MGPTELGGGTTVLVVAAERSLSERKPYITGKSLDITNTGKQDCTRNP